MAEHIKGWNELMAKMSSLTGAQLDEAAKKAVSSVAQSHQAAAKLLVPVGDGELRNSIHSKIDTDSGSVTGVVYTNSDHAAYVEFGTGPIGAASGGNGSAINVSYARGPWRHKSRSGKTFWTDYWIYRTEEGKFFATRGQPAKPYLYPSSKATEKQASRIMQKALKSYLTKLEG